MLFIYTKYTLLYNVHVCYTIIDLHTLKDYSVIRICMYAVAAKIK